MADPVRDPLQLLRWLVEAGADEAIREEPVNRFTGSRAAPSPPATRVPSTTAATASAAPLAEARKRASSLPQAEGGNNAMAQAVSLTTAPGAARSLAASCTTLAELKAAL